MMDLRQKLLSLQDLEYQKFHLNLCPNVNNIIGIRVPILRELAKEIARGEPREFLQNFQPKYYEEIMIEGLVIGYMKAELNERLKYLDQFVPKIDNWAICDTCVSTYKFVTKNQAEVWDYLKKYLQSKREFELRFAIIILMDYYLTDEYLERVLQIFNQINHAGYYVKMGVAWAVSVAMIKFPGKTLAFLQKNNLDDFTFNKALQKIIESNRVDEKTKNLMRKMKRK